MIITRSKEGGPESRRKDAPNALCRDQSNMNKAHQSKLEEAAQENAYADSGDSPPKTATGFFATGLRRKREQLPNSKREAGR